MRLDTLSDIGPVLVVHMQPVCAFAITHMHACELVAPHAASLSLSLSLSLSCADTTCLLVLVTTSKRPPDDLSLNYAPI